MPKIHEEIAGALPDDHERVVDDLLDVLIARGESRQETCQAAVIAEIQLLQGTPIPGRYGAQQVAVVRHG